MTPAQREMILTSLRSGVTLDRAVRAAKTTLTHIRAVMQEDDDLAEQIEMATAIGGATASKAKARGETKSPFAPPTSKQDEPARPEVTLGAPSPKKALPVPTSADIDESSERWAAIRRQAEEMGPGIFGYLRWVESRAVAAGLHPMDPQWVWHFDEFYKSGKMVDAGRFGLRAAKSDSCCRAIVAEVLLVERRLEPGLVGVCPVISQNMREADDRFDTIVRILSACGLNDLTGTRAKDDNGFQRSGGGSSARVIALRDSQGHPVEFRIYPASISGAAGFTGIAGFCDEVDLWGKEGAANPAARVFEVLFTRYTTQPDAKLHIMSASYHPDSAHAQIIARGDTPLQRVARLGDGGAKKDTADRSRLATLIGNTDPLLTKPGDPMSTDIPCWVSNPVAPIEDCYKKAEGNVKRMMQLYGGRVGAAGKASGTTLDELTALGEANRKLCAGDTREDRVRFDGLPSWDPRSRGFGRGGGEGSI